MKPRTFFVAAASLSLAAAALAGDGKDSKGTPYDVKGNYYETCACKVSCPCASNATLPTGGEHCDAISFVHIEKGMVGKTKMDGLNIGVVFRTPKDQKVLDAFEKGQMDLFTLYLDGKATAEQKEAMNTLLPALFGTKEFTGAKPPQWLPMTFEVNGDVAKLTVDGGAKLAFEIENLKAPGKTKDAMPKGENYGDRIELTNSAPFPWVSHVTQGISKKFHYDDLGTKWDYDGRNAFFGVMKASGMYKPEPPKTAQN